MSWKFDAPSGTYRNHALSTDIRRQAIANTQFMPFARNEPGYGRKRGESVTIPRFGNFEIRERSARKGRNPQTGAEIDIAASKAPAFKPAAALKRRVAE
jgi:hypothetical protein